MFRYIYCMIFFKWNRIVYYFIFVGGYLAYSLVIMIDVVYLFVDVGSMMGSFFFFWFFIRLVIRIMIFGWYRLGKVFVWFGDFLILLEVIF